MEKNLRQKIHGKYNGRCAYCGKQISVKEMQIDHFTPQIYGGTDSHDNLMPACRDCNNYKCSWDIELFRKHIEDIYEQLGKSAKWRVAEKFGIFKREKVSVKFYFETIKSS
jgi:5-methylcytosine-specific restriction endonuclease McrA